ncbi:hypothetical protein HDK90DRAFT_492418 [Phyllosticta capitalensis]|uniref:Secreted protein n=1 Tax=Phyllosticta capitalensis TaxID=121624 RepID=A0ABR1YGB0_9PEZI
MTLASKRYVLLVVVAAAAAGAGGVGADCRRGAFPCARRSGNLWFSSSSHLSSSAANPFRSSHRNAQGRIRVSRKNAPLIQNGTSASRANWNIGK